MPVTNTSDNREFQSTTVDEADKKFDQLAQLEIRIKARRASAEKRIADIKAKAEADTEADQTEYKELAEWLDKYILANKNRFLKPRMRKTAFGRYGLRTAKKLTITDEQAVIDSARKNELDDIIEMKYRINKKAVEQAIADGKDIDGAKIVSGDLAGFTVDKKLLDAALTQ
jgi:phage host-nuclease inhibitor protein Gam